MFRFSLKEHLFLTILAVLLAVLLIFCIYEAKTINTAKGEIAYYSTLDSDLEALESEYNALRVKNRQSVATLRISLFSLIDKIARRNRLGSSVAFIKPFSRKLASGASLDMVEIRLNSVSLKQIVHFLYDVEIRYKGRIFVKRIKMRKNKNSSLGMNAVFFTYKKGAAK